MNYGREAYTYGSIFENEIFEPDQVREILLSRPISISGQSSLNELKVIIKAFTIPVNEYKPFLKNYTQLSLSLFIERKN